MTTPSFWDVFVNPARATEAVHWVKKHPEETRNARGQYGETALHWGALSVQSLLIDLIDIGLPMQSADRSGKTPQDWQNDRLFSICVERSRNLSEGGRQRVLNESRVMIPTLWRMGGRPGLASPVDPLQIWVRAGLWELLDMRQDLNDMKWKGLGSQGESILHGWLLAPEGPEKARRLTQALTEGGLSVDEPNKDGRTPLWAAVDAWIARPAWARILGPAVRALIQAGASPDQVDREGISPRALALAAEDMDRSDQRALLTALGMPEVTSIQA